MADRRNDKFQTLHSIERELRRRDLDMSNQEKANNPNIFCLSPNAPLKREDMPTIDIYLRHLHSAFRNPNIRNLAVTGNFGVGKSSIIRSFDLDLYRQRGNLTADDAQNVAPQFLYVSLGAFSDFRGENLKPQKDNSERDINEINAIEKRILMQIYARFRQRDLPLSSFKLIQENVKNPYALWILSGFIFFFLTLTAYHEPLTPLLDRISESPYLSGFPLLLAFVYLCGTALVAGLAGWILSAWLPKYHFNQLAFKLAETELTVEKDTSKSYLDLYSSELVYCLQEISGQIGGTIVFEDMDRLDADVCVYIFTRLREINHLVNIRLADSEHPVRFIYAVNDEIIAKIQHTKFFDYTLSVIPGLTRSSSESVLVKLVRRVDKELAEEFALSWMERFCELEKYGGLIHEVAPFLTDYRLQYVILNDYRLIFSLYCESNPNHIEAGDAEHIFAFSVYKNVWPEDYYKIRDGESEIIPDKKYDKIEQYRQSWTHYELLNVLLKRDLLTAQSLFYSGYSEEEISKLRVATWLSRNNCSDIARAFASIQPFERTSLQKMCDFLKNGEFPESDKQVLFTAAINCVVRCGFRDNQEWFLQEKEDFQERIINGFETLRLGTINEFVKLRQPAESEPPVANAQ